MQKGIDRVLQLEKLQCESQIVNEEFSRLFNNMHLNEMDLFGECRVTQKFI